MCVVSDARLFLCSITHVKGITVLFQLWAERFLHKSSLNLGQFKAVEGVSAYSRVFLIKKISQQTYTFRLRPRTPRIEKTHSLLAYNVSLRYIAGSVCWGASNTSRAKRWPAVVLFVFFTKFTQSNSISNRSYIKSFYFLITHWLNYRRNNYFLLKHCSQRFKVKLREDVIHFFALNKGMFFGSLVTIITNLPPAHGHVACLSFIVCS